MAFRSLFKISCLLKKGRKVPIGMVRLTFLKRPSSGKNSPKALHCFFHKKPEIKGQSENRLENGDCFYSYYIRIIKTPALKRTAHECKNNGNK